MKGKSERRNTRRNGGRIRNCRTESPIIPDVNTGSLTRWNRLTKLGPFNMSTLRIPLKIALLCLLFAVSNFRLAAQETNVPPTTVPAMDVPPAALADAAETSAANDTLRAYLQIQEQLHATQLAIEQTRREAEIANEKNSERLAAQLQSVEQTLSAQRAREAHFMIYVLGAFAIISFLAVVITAYFQWRTVNRLASIAAAARPPLAHGPAVTRAMNDHALPSAAVEQSNGRLLGTVERLEKRILELEHSTRPALKNGAPAEPNGKIENGSAKQLSTASTPVEVKTAAESTGSPDRVRQLLDRGQALLDQDQAEAAVDLFDQVLQSEPDHAEALVKKGSALEKLRKLPEAIECYDRAIAADASMTIAYLYKGGLYNRMERFGEAVECYEKALQTQEKTAGAEQQTV